jgi:acyl carrier protein
MTTIAYDSDRKQIVDTVITALAEVMGQDMSGVTEETRLTEDLSLDSTSVLSLLLALVDGLDMQVDPESLEQRHLATVGSLTSYIIESR